MLNEMLLVVGDKFAQFTNNKNAITLTHLKEMLGQCGKNYSSHTILVPGQGLGDHDIETVLSEVERSPHSDHFDFTLWHKVPKRAANSRSHKHCPENTLISEPRKLSDDLYELDLLIDENCELMRDHQTGQHLQGMILLEAGRQALLAVTEAFFIPPESRSFFVFNDMDVRYNHFAFPFAAKIVYKILDKNIKKSSRQNFEVDISIVQCGYESASFRMVFSAIKNDLMSNREASMAGKTLDDYFDSVRQQMKEDQQQAAINA